MSSNRTRSTTWSPIDCLPGAKLTDSGLLDMWTGEVSLWHRPADLVELRAALPDEAVPALIFAGNLANTSGKTWVDRSLDCQLTITTHRIVFQQEQSESGQQLMASVNGSAGGLGGQNNKIKARYIHLSNLIADTQLEKGSFFKSARILLGTTVGELYVIFRGDRGSAYAKEVMQVLETAKRREEWEKETKLKKREETVVRQSTNQKVGVHAILSRSEARHQMATSVTTQAFSGDAETLMEEAQALIKIIERYVSTLDSHDKSSNSSNSSEEDNKRLTDMLQNMGMTSALRKADFKGQEKAYFSQLARELADFLRPKLKNTMMTLTDVYCLYNRARGSNLISPEDLLYAVDQMEQLSLGLSHYQFPSGLRVLQDAALNQENIANRILQLLSSKDDSSNSSNSVAMGGITDVEASRHLQVSVLLAHEQLLAAERQGSLVRDETTETIRFFQNRFVEWNKD